MRGAGAKLKEHVWWPSPECEAARRVATCSVCKFTQLSEALTAEQRMELYDRPFRVIFVDALGPTHPPDGEFHYLFHAE
eukprot:4161881-Alexandrium_andersonii.AAC.1